MGCAELDVADVASSEQELLGGLSFMTADGYVCSDAQKQFLSAAWQRGRRATMTPEFEVCMRDRMAHDYLPCQGHDPFELDPVETQVAKAIAASRTTNRASVGCNDNRAGTALAYTSIGSYGHDGDESMIFTSSYLDAQLAAAQTGVVSEAHTAGTFWHEALHTHGYLHDQVDAPSCGYGWDGVSMPSPQYQHSANQIAYGCVVRAALGNSVTPRGIASERRLGPGVYGAGSGLDPDVLDLLFAPAIGVAFCPTCNDWMSLGTALMVLTNPQTPLTYLRVTPRVVVFDKTQYGGVSRSLAIGVHPVTSLGSTIGNDAIRSMIVPAGVVVYACSDDLGGRGSGRCWIYDGPAADTTWMGGISYLEIMPRVTTLSDVDYYGSRQAFGIGAYTFVSPAQVRSIIVVPGQTATACTAPPGTAGRFCRSFSNSATDVGPELAGKVGYLEIASAIPPATFHVSASVGGGTIRSEPWGISCGEACSASFPAGSQLTLVATPTDPASTVSWTGCDSMVNGNCAITVSRDLGVTATFKTACDPQAVLQCQDGCSDACAGRKSGLASCINRCLAGCEACN